MFLKTNHFFIKRILFFFDLNKFRFCLRILSSNFAKLKDRQTPDIVIRLIIADVFETTVRINRIKKVNEPFAFIIIIKSYLCWTLKNQFQSNIARYSFKISRMVVMFLDTIGYCNQRIYKIL